MALASGSGSAASRRATWRERACRAASTAISMNLPPAAAARPAITDPARTAATISAVPPPDFSAGLAAQAAIFRLRSG